MHKSFVKYILVSLIFLFGASLFSSQKLKALNYDYPNYNVDITINQDSTFVVKETALYKFYGLAHGIRRDLILNDPNLNCSDIRTCGGFDKAEALSVVDNNGNDLNGKYTLSQITDSQGKRLMRFEWVIWPNGKQLNGEQMGWTITYKVYGGIQLSGGLPTFYWNVLPEQRGGIVDHSITTINFPNNVNFIKSNLIFYDYSPNVLQNNNSIKLELNNLQDGTNFTLAYRFNKEEITLPGNINLNLNPSIGTKIYLDNNFVDTATSGFFLKSVPVGDHTLKISHFGYSDINKFVSVSSGETTNFSAVLEPTTFMNILLFLNNIIFLLGCLLMPVALIFVYFYYRNHGRDKDIPKTIIPLFNPPENVKPYLLGTLKDENVDKEDITGTIIDLAYRGYIQIKEIEKDKNYELTRLNRKTQDSLDKIETDLMNSLFTQGNTTETNTLKYSFINKYNNIVTKIYNLLVERGYYIRSPRATTEIFIASGTLILILGIVIFIIFSIIYTYIIGYISLFTPALALSLIGLSFIIVSKAMPSKTSLGSKVLSEILGFRMYLYTADRYRLQNLGPNEFEKYLSYAIVFGIEKQWAQRFQGIYNQTPDWYIGSGNVYDAIWISSFARSFSNSTIASMTPISNNTSNGSGWSGGGSGFSGFSGGGGGGGSSGGF